MIDDDAIETALNYGGVEIGSKRGKQLFGETNKNAESKQKKKTKTK